MKFKKPKRPIDFLPSKPDKALQKVWSMESLDAVREQIDIWFYASLCSSGGIYDDPADREMFILFYHEFQIFIEAVYFYNKSLDTERRKNYEEASDEQKEFLDSLNLPTNLTEEQLLNPLPIIQAFCDKFSIKYIRIELWDWFESVVFYKGGEFHITKEYVSIQYLRLLTLCEAAHVIANKK